MGSALNGMRTGRDTVSIDDVSAAGNTGQTIMALDVAAFGDVADFKRRIDKVARDIRTSKPMPGLTEVRYPGLQGHRTALAREKNGIPIARAPGAKSRQACRVLGHRAAGGRTMNGDSSRNIRFLARTDQGGKPDGVQFMLHRSGYGFVGQTYAEGVSILDLRDPKNPKPAAFAPMPANTRASHIQLHEDLLLVANGPNPAKSLASADYFTKPLADTQRRDLEFAAGIRVYDVSRPENPREVGFMPVNGLGVHRMWYVGGRYLYCSAHFEGFADHILTIVDLREPMRPEIVGRWWMPGMWRAGGENPAWKGRYALHHALVAGTLAYGAWRDGGLTVHDVSDPARPRLLVHRNWSPPFGGGTHSPLPLPGRNLLARR